MIKYIYNTYKMLGNVQRHIYYVQKLLNLRTEGLTESQISEPSWLPFPAPTHSTSSTALLPASGDQKVPALTGLQKATERALSALKLTFDITGQKQ